MPLSNSMALNLGSTIPGTRIELAVVDRGGTTRGAPARAPLKVPLDRSDAAREGVSSERE